MASIRMKCLKKEIISCGSKSVEKRNRCVIFPAEASIVADSLQRRNKSWFIKAKVVSDLIIHIGEESFHLHKLPMVRRSGYINRQVTQSSRGSNPTIRIDNIPGEAKAFELVVKFSYGWNISFTAANIAPLYCAAHFLEMTDDLQQGNLISETQSFLSYVILSSWKDIFRILQSCESISTWARDLQVLRHCSDAIAWKVCTEHPIGFGDNEALTTVARNVPDDWWFEDVSLLHIDQFVEVIAAMRRKKIRPELVGSCVANWTRKWLSQITNSDCNLKQKSSEIRLHKVTAEYLIKVLPVEENSVSFNFLLYLLKIGHIMQINSELLMQLERRIAIALETCKATDLLIKNRTTLFDVDVVTKVVETYVSIASTNPLSKMPVVGRLLDEYLVLVARDENLPARTFQLLVDALPRNARYCHNNIYRAVDMYLKAHPDLTEDERSKICKVIDFNKLSQVARKHALKNDRLPTNITTQLLLLEQVAMTRSLTAAGSNYQRTKSQAILRANKALGNGRTKSINEIAIMRRDVENLKVQLGELQLCRSVLQKQMKTGII
ncbi:hypothetical protein ACH5RR_001434 [Cinchona calisaya]|uniref:Phototropic-responsive NPH3 family protein n=1 Tax=Cinchona calisaya TaxID=153742 RepID=A0ABD3B464_9GENT